MMTDEEVAAIQQDARDQLGVELAPEDIDPARAAIRDAKSQLGVEIREPDIRTGEEESADGTPAGRALWERSKARRADGGKRS